MRCWFLSIISWESQFLKRINLWLLLSLWTTTITPKIRLNSKGCQCDWYKYVWILGWLIPPLLSKICFAPFLLVDLKFKEGRNNFCFCRKILFNPPQGGVSPPKSGNSKFSQLYVVGTLNLYLKTPGTMQKESDQSDHPVMRKRPKCAVLLEYFDVGLKEQNRTTFWTFSLGRVIGLSWFLLHCARRLGTQV